MGRCPALGALSVNKYEGSLQACFTSLYVYLCLLIIFIKIGVVLSAHAGCIGFSLCCLSDAEKSVEVVG